MNKLLLSLLVLLSAPTLAAQEKINTQALKACSFIESDFNRLLCYDNIMAGKILAKESVTEKLAPSKTTDIPAVAVTKADDFGLEHKEEHNEKGNEITAIIISVEEAPYGELIITLDNNQQWRQIGSDSMRLKAADKVMISRGMFNSFLLRKEGQNRSIRVKRTQ